MQQEVAVCLQTIAIFIDMAAKFLWINRQTSKEEQRKNKLQTKIDDNLGQKLRTTLANKKIYILIKKVSGKEVFEKL